MTPRLNSFLGLSLDGFHRVAYWEWGPVDAERTVVCVHGLTRQGRDFDALAQVLVQSGWRVVCPDLVGRGRSGWLRNPAGYTLLQYGADMNALLARLDVKAVDWIGTSLGGLVGMVLAAQPDSPIRRLAINDIGPFIPNSALRRLGAYLDAEPHFADLAEAVAYFRLILAPYGELAEDQWRHLAEHSIRPDDRNGGYRLHHDPAIRVAYRTWRYGSVMLWPQWHAVRCPTLVLRGSESDMLTSLTAREMAVTGPRATLVEFPGVGHVPALMTRDQIEPIVEFLGAP